ncbi:tyrosine-type recombinase/integrase [Parasporobacterium paucivorans]|uniref:Phage integrase, N-terminal SAM-like domain n=1 Tax=Parasporobacterium paucivorans DSM 15970 TaxID=1122934 RepID=A0A1M6IP82_9FIRM|nr:site-specific integrase [Parasporobacterium paucivorans]SHJ36271.1 Phage integrase, N-terminal SAM-like domain [Parasporobacterium paucivorans DSM 15970]
MYTGKKVVSGHLEPRKNSKGEITHYRAVLFLGRDENGKQIKPYKKARTKEAAEALLIQMKAEYLNSEFILPSEMKVNDYLEEWYAAYIVNQRSESTELDYREIMDRYLIPTWGKAKLQALSTLHIQKTFNAWGVKSPLSDKPLSDETLKHIRRVFNTALNKAVDLEFLKKNPLKGVTIGRRNVKKELEVFSEDEIQRLFKGIKGTDDELIIVFLFDTLARRSEALGARWSDLDMKSGILTIQHTYIRTLNGCKFKDGTKSQSSKRSMVLTDYTMGLLRKEKLRQLQNKLKHGPKYEDNDLIICQENGRPYQGSSFYQKWSRILKKNGIRHIKLHGSRHSGISMMIALGLNPKSVQERAGHKSCDITMNIYAHVNQDQKNKTAQVINDDFFKNVSNG